MDAVSYRDGLIDRRLSKSSSINNYSFVIKNYHRMIGDPVELPFIKTGEKLLYVFDENDVQKLFDSTANLKHLAIFQSVKCLAGVLLCY